MNTGGQKIFLDKKKLSQLIQLRKNGVSEGSLALMFGCAKSSIITQLQKHHVKKPSKVFSAQLNTRWVLKDLREKGEIPVQEDKYFDMGGRRINRGKSYAEYLKNKR